LNKRDIWKKNVCPDNNNKKFTRKETIEEATCATIKLHEANTVVPFKIRRQAASSRQAVVEDGRGSPAEPEEEELRRKGT
jgi:hypothetical protein